ncbi:DNA-processing protein DprA, partial [Microbacterium sp.]|uniref:DNA-processing protein DprA n=1 Tax=Microbacterium sp. TaxID=51671 RepID=UPI0039E7259F
ARWRPRAGENGGALAQARRAGARIVTAHDPQWPTALGDLGEHAPLCLWVRGDPALLAHRPAVAFVGARAASGYGEHVVVEWAAELAGTGVAIVSGAAYGIDGMAHRAALAAGGVTIAVLAGGVDRPYPAGHVDLLRRIVQHGVVVSELPCGSAPTKWRFLQRNRSIAALADATVVVEAGSRSGSLNTAGHAAALGRPLGAVPGPVTNATSAGCHRLLREFDARCVTSPDEVRELLGLGVGEVLPTGAHTDERTRILDALSTRAERTTDEVARRSGMSPLEAEALLGLLVLDGTIARGAQGWRRMPRC